MNLSKIADFMRFTDLYFLFLSFSFHYIIFRCKNAEKYSEAPYHLLLPLQYPK